MEQLPEKPKKSGLPLWLLFVLLGVIIVMTLAVIFVVLLYLDVLRCERVDAPIAEVTPAAVQTDSPTEPPKADATPEPILTAAPTDAPTEVPTEEPTAVPTEEPTPAPTEKPDSFTFGGKTVKTGETKINGKNLGINGKSKKLTHITKDEVENLVNLCPDLEELVLDYCYMDDYTPLGGLTKLRKLQLSSCGGSGGNAVKHIDWVKDLTALRTLNFAHNEIDDTSALAGLSKLTWLSLMGNPLTDEDLEPIGKLENLESLYLNNLRKITNVEPLSNLSKLTFLHLGNNSKLVNVKPLTKLNKLVYLRLNCTKVSDLTDFGKLTALKKLDLSKCPIKTGTVKNLRGCKKLETIVLEQGDTDLYYAVLDQLINEGYPVHFAYSW